MNYVSRNLSLIQAGHFSPPTLITPGFKCSMGSIRMAMTINSSHIFYFPYFFFPRVEFAFLGIGPGACMFSPSTGPVDLSKKSSLVALSV